MSEKKKPGLTDEQIGQAAAEVEQAILDQLPDPADCHHEFSDEFKRKMNELCPGLHPEIGPVKKD